MKTVMSLSPYALTISGSFLPSLVVSQPPNVICGDIYRALLRSVWTGLNCTVIIEVSYFWIQVKPVAGMGIVTIAPC